MKRTPMNKASLAVVGALITAMLLGGAHAAFGAGEYPGPITLAQAQPHSEQEATANPAAQKADLEQKQEEETSFPLSVTLSYMMCTDYIFRGVNFSEYANEGREDLNHQLTVSLALDLSKLGLGDIGTIGYDTWFEWFAGQKNLNPQFGGGQNLQEVDYTIWYLYNVEAIKTSVKLGFTFYEFVNTARLLGSDGQHGNNNDDRSQEWQLTLGHNDAWMWKWLFPDNEDGVLNPTFFFAQDFANPLGEWMEIGFSHAFSIPGVDNLTITPGYTLCVQNNYWKQGFFVAGDQLSLGVDYDLTPVLQMPSWAGKLVLGGKLVFFNPYGNFERETGSNNNDIRAEDQLWGGMTVTWSWGG